MVWYPIPLGLGHAHMVTVARRHGRYYKTPVKNDICVMCRRLRQADAADGTGRQAVDAISRLTRSSWLSLQPISESPALSWFPSVNWSLRIGVTLNTVRRYGSRWSSYIARHTTEWRHCQLLKPRRRSVVLDRCHTGNFIARFCRAMKLQVWHRSYVQRRI